jgi:hypothetical protein
MVPGMCFGMFVSVVGLFTIPVGIVIALALHRRSGGREMLGLITGIGITITFIGSLHGNYQACSAEPRALVLRPGQASAGFSCGGVDGPHWLIVGVALTIAAAAMYWYTARRAGSGGATSATPTPS